MSRDQLLGVIESIHAASLDAALWPAALEAATDLVGGVAATIEIAERGSFRHDTFYSHGVPKPEEMAYLSHYAPLSPRFPPEVLRQRPGEINWDYRVVDETAIEQSPFYMDFLAKLGMRYFVGGIIKTAPTEFGAFAIQRSPRNGHVDRSEIDLMRRLVPHASQAMEVTRRLRRVAEAKCALESAFDWLPEGVALLDADGRITYANEALAAIARAGDGIAIRDRRIEFAAPAVRRRFADACRRLALLRDGDPAGGGGDIPVARRSGAPAYLVSARPLSRRGADASTGRAVALVLVTDPLHAGRGTATLMRDLFGLTPAEGALAQALQEGIAVSDYAKARGISFNTVYTHLRRLKEKTGCRRLAELTRTLNDVRVPPLDPKPR
jgi:DNA-binding CsgD family transcriptional regulator